MIKNFSCFKVLEKKEGQPDYRLSANLGTTEAPEYVDIGAGWIKDGAKGKFISFSLAKPYNEKKGWKLVSEETATVAQSPTDKVNELYNSLDKPNPDDIPF